MILADGSVSESEMVAFRRICKEAFGIPEASIIPALEGKVQKFVDDPRAALYLVAVPGTADEGAWDLTCSSRAALFVFYAGSPC